MNGILQSYNGLIRFYDGTVITIKDQEYSADGKYNWEKVFNPYQHIALDGITIVQGHKYKRVKHSGDTSFQLPYRIIPDEPVFRVLDGQLQYKLHDADDSTYVNLFDLNTLQGQDGAKGDKGLQGEGWHIDTVGYISTRPNCNSSLNTGTCQSCNSGDGTNYEYSTFLSIGDGTLIITAAIKAAGTVTVDSVAYTHFSNDKVTWTALTGGIVDFQARYLATNSTGAVYTDMRTEDYYSSRGVVYVCADGQWVVGPQVATPTYQVKERDGSSNIGFLNNFVDEGDFDTISQTVTLDSGKLALIQGSIDNTAFDTSVAGYGLDYTLGSPIDVDPSEFNGFGISTYVADSDSEVKLQVLVDDLIGDGTRVQSAVSVDGEVANLLGVDVNDLINNNSGLIATAQVDTFYDLSVNLGDGLILDGGTPQAITINTDELSLEVNATDLHIKSYVSGNDGVMKKHLNPDIIWANHGVGFDQLNGIYARIDALTIGYNGAGALEVPVNGITGDRLNDDVADNDKGLEISNEMLAIKVDGTSIGFINGNLTVLNPVTNLVTSLTVNDNGVTGNTVNEAVVLRMNDTASIDLTISAVSATDTIAITADINQGWLNSEIDARIALGGTASVYWGVLQKASNNSQTIEAYVTGLNYTKLDYWYDDTMISTTHGLVLKSPVSAVTYKVIVDDQGNLDTEEVTLA